MKNRRGGTNAVEERFEKLSNVQGLLEMRLPEYAKLMTEEMGKPLAQSEAEVSKCSGMIEYSVAHSLKFMQD